MNEFILAKTTICFIGEKGKGNTDVCNFFYGIATLKTGIVVTAEFKTKLTETELLLLSGRLLH
jgi:hypothetical protein